MDHELWLQAVYRELQVAKGVTMHGNQALSNAFLVYVAFLLFPFPLLPVPPPVLQSEKLKTKLNLQF